MRKKEKKTLTVTVDSDLAAAYKAAYVRAIGPESRKRESLAKFMAGFVEDRLVEETMFLDGEDNQD